MEEAVYQLITQVPPALEALATTTGIALVPDPLGASLPVVSIPDQLQIIRGQNPPNTPEGQQWQMSNNVLYFAKEALRTQVASLRVEQESLRDVVLQGFTDIATMFGLLNSQRQLDLAAAQVEHTRNDLQDAKDELQDAAMQELQIKQIQLAQQLQLVQAQAELNGAKNVEQDARLTAGELKNAAQDAEDARQRTVDEAQNAQAALTAANLEKVRLQQVADETNIEADRLAAANALTVAQAALAKAEQATQAAATADSKAVLAKTAADAAQAKADLDKQQLDALQGQVTQQQQALTSTNQALATQTTRLDTAAASITTLTAAASTAQATADQAKAAVAALADKGRVLLGVVTPASVGLLGIGGTLTIPLTWTKAFPGTSYAGSFLRTSGGTAAMGVSLTNKTTTSCTLVLTLTGTVSLAVPAGTGDVVLTYA